MEKPWVPSSSIVRQPRSGPRHRCGLDLGRHYATPYDSITCRPLLSLASLWRL